MPNAPRPDNPARHVRVETPLWEAAAHAAELEGTTRAEVMRQALVELVARNPTRENGPHPEHTGQGPGRLVRRRP